MMCLLSSATAADASQIPWNSNTLCEAALATLVPAKALHIRVTIAAARHFMVCLPRPDFKERSAGLAAAALEMHVM
jgi:hypothetical protein